jgi:hypothetical protein
LTFTFIDNPKDKAFLQQFSVSLTAKLENNAQIQIKYSGNEAFITYLCATVGLVTTSNFSMYGHGGLNTGIICSCKVPDGRH